MAPQKYGVPIAKGSANPDHSRLKGRLVKGSRPAVRVDLNSKKTFSLDQATEVDDPDPIRIVFTRPLSPSAQTKTSQAKTDNSTGARSTADRRPRKPQTGSRPRRSKAIRTHLRPSAPLCGANRQAPHARYADLYIDARVLPD